MINQYSCAKPAAFAFLALAAPTAGAQEAPILLETIVLQSRSTAGQGYATGAVGIGGVETQILSMPRSVEVVTADLLQDRGLSSVYDAIESTNGATIVMQDDIGERSVVLIRGFEANSIQIDGMPSSGNKNLNLFDTAIYDRIEVLRGPAGVMQGSREPGGTVNLVRKRPTSDPRLSLPLEIGSWGKRRAVVDWSGPLGGNERLRGRVVGAVDRADSFTDLVGHEKRLAYGVLEYDLTDATTLTFGGTWQKGDEVGSRGLPTYADGTLLDVDRSVFAGLDWVRSETDAHEVFTELTHSFENGVVFTLKGALQNRDRDGKLAFSDGAVDRETGLGRLRPEWRLDHEEGQQLTAGLELPFMLWGLDQRVILSADYQNLEQTLDLMRGDRIPFNFHDPDYSLPEPEWQASRFDLKKQREFGLTAQAEIRPTDQLTLLAGGRLGWWESSSVDRPTGAVSAELDVNAEFTPYLAAQYELTPGSSVYASYATAFVPQTDLLAAGGFVEPRTAEQFELGYKREVGTGALLELALFNIEDANRAVDDPDDETDTYSVGSGKVRSRGVEVQISGEVVRNLDMSLGYTYASSEYVEDPIVAGAVFEPRMPRHSLRLWGKYTFDQGMLDRWSLAGGLSAFSERSRTTDGITVSQGGYYTADLRVAYLLREDVELALSVTNIFDRNYYHSVGYTDRQNYFGAPRAFSLQLNSQF